MKLKKRNPNDPEVIERVLARLRQMSADETIAFLRQRPEGIEQTNMNQTLAEYDNQKLKETSQPTVA